jgi:hypothetical protein
MNYLSIVLAALGGFVAYFVIGGLGFVLLPGMKVEFAKHPAVYRDSEGIKKTMPLGMAAMLVSILAMAVIYALMYRSGWGVMQGAEYGALMGVFVLGAFVVHNYVNLQISMKLTVNSGVAYFIEWLAVGVVIGLIYHPMV